MSHWWRADANLESLFPFIPWREPITISLLDGISRIGCRYCLAQNTTSGRDVEAGIVPYLFQSIAEFNRHMQSEHTRGTR